MKETILPNLFVFGLITLPLLLILIFGLVFQVNLIALILFLIFAIIPLFLLLFVAREEVLFKLKLRFLRKLGYGCLEVVGNDFLRRWYVVKFKDPIRLGNMAWKYKPELVTFKGGIPIYTVNEKDAIGLDLLEREERTLVLDSKEELKEVEIPVETGKDEEGNPIIKKVKKWVVKVRDIRPYFKPEQFFDSLVEAEQKGRIKTPIEQKMLLLACIAAAIMAAIAAMIAFQTQTQLNELINLVKAIPKPG